MIYKKLFFKLFIKPVLFVISGMTVKGRENIPKDKQYIVVANHNSHLDTVVIMSLFDSKEVINISPVAAADYFFSNRFITWISKNLLDITPISRKIKLSDAKERPLLENVFDAIKEGKNLIIFPEGSRGKAEQLQRFKSGIGHIIKKYPDIIILPILLKNTGKSLPKNEALFVPFIIDIEIKKPITFDKEEDIKTFTKRIEEKFTKDSSD